MTALLFLFSACTFAPGAGFGDLAEASLSAALVPGAARDLGGGEVLTQAGYAVRVDTFELDLGDLSLLALSGGGSTSFDPANPPEGYTLCHGGHCHADDGSLVDYADIEAELAGGTAAFQAVVTLPVAATADLVGGATFDLDTSAWHQLPAGDVSKLEIGASAVRIEGIVRRHPDDGWSAPLTVDLPLAGALGTGFDLPLARGEDPTISLGVAVEPDGTLFDALEFSALEGDEGVVLDSLDDEAGAALAATVLAVAPVVTVERTP